MTKAARRRRARGLAPGDDTGLQELQQLVELAALGDAEGVEVRRIRPSQARKGYLCPGCQQQIAPATGHLVVVPTEAPDLRRHWHTPCWTMRERRRPGR